MEDIRYFLFLSIFNKTYVNWIWREHLLTEKYRRVKLFEARVISSNLKLQIKL